MNLVNHRQSMKKNFQIVKKPYWNQRKGYSMITMLIGLLFLINGEPAYLRFIGILFIFKGFVRLILDILNFVCSDEKD